MTPLSERAYLALTIFAEARNQPLAGQVAVGEVILRRVKTLRWGRTIQAVVTKRRQFSCWTPEGGVANHKALARAVALIEACGEDGAIMRDPILATAFFVADAHLAHLLREIVPEATHYYAPRAVPKPPRWAKAPARKVCSLRDHDFWANVA